MDEVVKFLQDAKTFWLATVDGDQPHVRPFGAVNVFEGKLYIQTGLKKKVAKQMLANPKIEISAMVGGDWIRLTAEAIYDPRSEAQASMLDANPGLKQMYAVDDGNTAVFYLQNATAEFDSFTKEPHVVKF